MNRKEQTQSIHEGQFVAEVEVDLLSGTPAKAITFFFQHDQRFLGGLQVKAD